MDSLNVIRKFDTFLDKKGLTFEAVVIGGAALNILGFIARQTQEVGLGDTSLKENWLNHGPESLRKYLRKNWKARLQPLFNGKAITFTTLGRVDLLGTKLLAYCDRGRDLQDCLDSKPSRDEILEILPWVQGYDVNPNWAEYCQGQIQDLAKRLGYEL